MLRCVTHMHMLLVLPNPRVCLLVSTMTYRSYTTTKGTSGNLSKTIIHCIYTAAIFPRAVLATTSSEITNPSGKKIIIYYEIIKMIIAFVY